MVHLFHQLDFLFQIIVYELLPRSADLFLPAVVEPLVHLAGRVRPVWEEHEGLVL